MNKEKFNKIAGSVIRLSMEESDGVYIRGTGFLCQCFGGSKFIVTTRHFVESKGAIIEFSLSGYDKENSIIYTGKYKIPKELSFLHPDKKIDLAIIFPPLRRLFPNFLPTIKAEDLVLEKEMAKLSPIEKIIFTGCPGGYEDDLNNLPIVQHAKTASPLYVNHEGEPTFLIDAPIHPGSSGSPVFLDAEDISRTPLLGILHAAAVDDPDLLAMNLGVVIKAEEILNFDLDGKVSALLSMGIGERRDEYLHILFNKRISKEDK